jgi:hypothetical protein
MTVTIPDRDGETYHKFEKEAQTLAGLDTTAVEDVGESNNHSTACGRTQGIWFRARSRYRAVACDDVKCESLPYAV